MRCGPRKGRIKRCQGRAQRITFDKPVSQLGMAGATRDAERGEVMLLWANVEWSAGVHQDFGDLEMPTHAGEVERLIASSS